MVTWTEQEALEKWLKTSANEVKAMSARNMRTVCPSSLPHFPPSLLCFEALARTLFVAPMSQNPLHTTFV
jgi:hypothetical protein